MPTFTTIDGVSRELTGWPVMIGGVSRELDSMIASIDGVQREIFSAVTRWERHGLRHYFGAYTTEEGESFRYYHMLDRYVGNYKESGTVSTAGDAVVRGQYICLDGLDYWVLRPYNSNNSPAWGWAYLVTSYTVSADPAVIDIVESTNSTAYPENGEHTDGYWYVKIS